jgi:protein O-mannosyl-transferase
MMIGQYPLVTKYRLWLGFALISVIASALYLPFLHNPFVFDDWALFDGSRFSYYATHPFDFLSARNLPYFSLALTYILGSGIPTQRIVSLILHLACTFVLCKLIYDLLRLVPLGRADSADEYERKALTLALCGAAAFAIHPVAVYGAGYLVQRTIVFATLFSLLSMVLFLRGLRRGAHADAVSAALMYTVAVYSKEHSILLPAAAVLIAILAAPERRFALRHCAIYLTLCAPAAIMVALLSKGTVGTTYEPDFGGVSDQLEGVFGLDIAGMPKSLSAVTQAGLFFRYLLIWVWPDLGDMSIDLRLDFTQHASAGWMILKVCAFVLYGALGLVLLSRRGRQGLVGFGMLYVWILFLAEFSVARFQEPFVLYRSYLWAPGILISSVAALSALPGRATLPIFVIVIPLLWYQAHDRLVSFSSPFLLWQDAVAKLPEKPAPWGSRALHNLAREYMYVSKPGKAVEIIERCMTQYPDTYHCYFAKGAILLDLGHPDAALPYFERAVALNPKRAMAHQRLALTLEKLGRVEEAIVVLRNASNLGFAGADMELRRLTSDQSKPRFR